ncbi:MAG: hypothetical protein ACOYH4_06210 [Saccharofermentanales bacterium]|jgi:hypothetical protein
MQRHFAFGLRTLIAVCLLSVLVAATACAPPGGRTLAAARSLGGRNRYDRLPIVRDDLARRARHGDADARIVRNAVLRHDGSSNRRDDRHDDNVAVFDHGLRDKNIPYDDRRHAEEDDVRDDHRDRRDDVVHDNLHHDEHDDVDHDDHDNHHDNHRDDRRGVFHSRQ